MSGNLPLRYDEDLVEAAVFLCASGRRPGIPSLQLHRFHRARERLYSILDPDQRNAAFFRLHLEWFREWGLERALANILKEFPLLPGVLTTLVFRKARGRNEEGAELYVSAETGRNGVVALCPERFENDETLACLLRHELTHLQDMVDPAFGYSPHLQLPAHNPAQQRLTRERYRLLWDITIDGRLTRGDRATMGSRDQHRALFDRAYSFWSESKRAEVFESLWCGGAPCHTDLLALASDPRDLASVHAPAAGAACPLCSFPTFHWADASRLDSAVAQLIGTEFPHWTPAQGLCSRCAKVYEIARLNLM